MSTVRRQPPRLRRKHDRRPRPERRLLRGEQLERRLLLASDWQNFSMPLDANFDENISSMDALVVINDLNQLGSRTLGARAEAEAGGPTQYAVDVNGDGSATPSDVLEVINHLNGEGETGPVVRYSLRVFDATGTNEVTSVGLGQEYILKAFVQDIRMSGRAGTFSAYLDVLYNSNLTSVIEDAFIQQNQTTFEDESVTIFHNLDQYGNGQSGDTTTTAGRIDGAGSFSGSTRPLGPSEFLLWQVKLKANAEGTVTFAAEPTTDPSDPFDAGQSPALDTGQYNSNLPVCPSAAVSGCEGEMVFVNDTVQIVSDIFADNEAVTIAEDSGSVTIDVLTGDQVNNPPNTQPVIESNTNPASGTVTRQGNNYVYTPNANFNGTDQFTYTINNGQGAKAVGTVAITVTAVNDAPVNKVPGNLSVNEDTNLTFTGANAISVSDVDGAIDIDVNIKATNGTLNVTPGSTTVSGNNSGDITISGSLANVNTALGTLIFRGSANFTGSSTVTVTSNDKGNVGGAALTDVDSFTVTVNAVNDPPAFTGAVDQTPVFFTETLTFSASSNNAITVTDPDAQQLSLTININQGGTLKLGSTQNLTVTGDGSASLTISGTPAAINAGLNGAVFTPNVTSPVDATVTLVARDGGQTGAGGEQTTTANFVIPIVPPTKPFAASDRFTTDEEVNLTFSTAELTDNDLFTDDMTSFSITSFDSTTTGGGSVALNNSTFTYTPAANFFGTDSFTYTIDQEPKTGEDYNGPSTGTVFVTVTAINDAPVLTLPGARTIDEDTTLNFNNGISIADADGNVDTVVTLTVASGTLTAASGGAEVETVSAGNIKLRGTVSQINTSLNGLTYRPTLNFSGSDRLSISVDDQGNTGRGTAVVNGTIDLTINAVNDAPVVTLPNLANKLFITDFDNVFSAAEGSAIQVSDVDAGSADIQVRLQVTNGSLTVSNTSGLTSSTGNNSGTVTLVGSQSAINAALNAGVTFRTSVKGNVTLTVSADDRGNTGSGNQTTDSESATFEVFEFIPSTIGGRVYVDADKDGVFDAGERAIGDVDIVLSGTDFRGAAVNLTVQTDKSGRYSFNDVRPGTYTVIEIQPAMMLDGPDRFQSPVSAVSNDRGRVEIGIRGGVSSLNNDFTELGLEAAFFDGMDLTTPAQPGGQLYNSILFGVSGDNTWSIFLGDAWGNHSRPRLQMSSDLRSATVTVFDSSINADRTTTVTFDSARLRVKHDGNGNMVIRVIGRPEDLFTSAAPEGEGDDLAAAEPQSQQQYEDGVDAVMSQYA